VRYRHGSRRQNGGPQARRALHPAAARDHERRQARFGHVPEDEGRQTGSRHAQPGPLDGAANCLVRMAWSAIVIAALRKRCISLLPVAWRIPRWHEAHGEPVVDSLGPVEIGHVPAAGFVGTCVHGEPANARHTGLQRLTGYLNGDNSGGAVLRAEGPVIQQQLGPQLWLISVRLPMVRDDAIAPAPRAPKVKLWPEQPGWLAVVRMSGRPAHDAVAAGDAMVLDAIANTDWVATGAPMVRLRASRSVQWFASSFEVAVPVVPRCHDHGQFTAALSTVEHLPAG
jgi:SOUL heme-binding protein